MFINWSNDLSCNHSSYSSPPSSMSSPCWFCWSHHDNNPSPDSFIAAWKTFVVVCCNQCYLVKKKKKTDDKCMSLLTNRYSVWSFGFILCGCRCRFFRGHRRSDRRTFLENLTRHTEFDWLTNVHVQIVFFTIFQWIFPHPRLFGLLKSWWML